jgi:hypothetical protein
MNNDVLDEAFQSQAHGNAHCKRQLGGIIKSLYQETAWLSSIMSTPMKHPTTAFDGGESLTNGDGI